MKYVIELDRHDLVELLAQHYDVSPKDVVFEIGTTTEGYGISEHQVPYVKVKINKCPPEKPNLSPEAFEEFMDLLMNSKDGYSNHSFKNIL